MLEGILYRNTPIIKITVAKGNAVQTPFVILDTGFTGDLAATPQLAKELGLKAFGITTMGLANGVKVNVPVSIAISYMEGSIDYITVLICKGSPLIGIGFLTKFNYKAIVDCKNKIVRLEKA